ncbi:hypothetical protein [Gloeocapsa sp. PCC 73106]|uniref:Tse2 family ADP-ribosyltransferase toxin n=1 Tax=Gloeocapsa sp. PCC 73106 TaxID=102232 RepID=UPI0002AC2640|nr:hypothetical protein [Gloeocapsa sp. PCC 73106]ELR99404.1 hypothetical protein GLO73106DRAFT_00032550 [Gloeocapsa sp. PCC 73106]
MSYNEDENPGNEVEPAVILTITLYAFCNKISPRPPRPNLDLTLINDLVVPTQTPTGASTFADIRYAPLTGHYYRLDKGTRFPSGLAVIADGKEVGGTHSLTHHTIYPIRPMPIIEFVEKFLNCGWVYVGKKEIRYKV